MRWRPNRGASATRNSVTFAALCHFRPVSSRFYNVLRAPRERHRRLLGGKNPPGDQTRRTGMVRGFMLGAVTALALAAATPAHAVIELQWWHAMTGGNN